MKIILLKDIKNLGEAGAVVKVKDGYARNYLLPCRLAEESTPQNLHLLHLRKEKSRHLEEKNKQEASGIASKISKLSLTIPCQAKDDEELFGSVTAQIIAKTLKEEGFDINKGKIILPEPIKKLGIYKVKVQLFPNVEAEFKLWVVKK